MIMQKPNEARLHGMHVMAQLALYVKPRVKPVMHHLVCHVLGASYISTALQQGSTANSGTGPCFHH